MRFWAFDQWQYGGTEADGVSFFLVDAPRGVDPPIRLLAAAGYDPRAALAIATGMSRLGDGEGRASWSGSRREELAGIVARAPTGVQTDSEEFQHL